MGLSSHARYMRAKYKPYKTTYAKFLSELKVGDKVGVVLASKVVIDTVKQIAEGPINLVHCHAGGREKIHQGPVIVCSEGSFSKVGGHGLFNNDFFVVPASRDILLEDAKQELFDQWGGSGRMAWFTPGQWKPEQAIAAFALMLSFEEARRHGSWIENHFRERDDRPTTLEALYAVYPEHRALIDTQIKPYSDAFQLGLEESKATKAQEDELLATTVKAGKKVAKRG